ncbi:hypothetical protein CsSME_00012165 [Camellia sinensis var. sinensis]
MAINDVVTQLHMIKNTHFGASGVHGGHKDLYKLSHFGSPVDSGNLCCPTVYNSGWFWGINFLMENVP